MDDAATLLVELGGCVVDGLVVTTGGGQFSFAGDVRVGLGVTFFF